MTWERISCVSSLSRIETDENSHVTSGIYNLPVNDDDLKDISRDEKEEVSLRKRN